MKKNLLLALIVALVAMFAAACGAPTPEKLCAKAEEKDRAECTKGLEEIKKGLDEINKDLWADYAKCVDGKDKMTQENAIKCIGETESVKKAIEEKEKKK